MGTENKDESEESPEYLIDKLIVLRLPYSLLDKHEEKGLLNFLEDTNNDLLTGVRIRSLVPVQGTGDHGWVVIHLETTLAIETALKLKKK